MSIRRTPPLSIEGSREVLEEMGRPPADTHERRRTLEMAARWWPLDGTLDRWVYDPGPEDDLVPGSRVARTLT